MVNNTAVLPGCEYWGTIDGLGDLMMVDGGLGQKIQLLFS